MIGHVDDKLSELALDVLSPEERAAVELHLASCSRCADELRELREVVSAVASLAVSAPPSEETKSRLLSDIEGRARYAPFSDRVARFFGIDVEGAARALESITEEAAWQPGPMPGMSSAKVLGRPKVASRREGFAPSSSPGPRFAAGPQQMAVFLRTDAGSMCPDHRHIGEERLLILEGALVEADGSEFRAGDLVVKPAGSSHAFHIPEGQPCIAAYLLNGGMELVS